MEQLSQSEYEQLRASAAEALDQNQVVQDIRVEIAGLSEQDRAVCNNLVAQIRTIASSRTGMLALALVGAEMAAGD